MRALITIDVSPLTTVSVKTSPAGDHLAFGLATLIPPAERSSTRPKEQVTSSHLRRPDRRRLSANARAVGIGDASRRGRTKREAGWWSMARPSCRVMHNLAMPGRRQQSESLECRFFEKVCPGYEPRSRARVHRTGGRLGAWAELPRCEVVDIGIITKQLGQASITTTARYLDHIRPEAVSEPVRSRDW